MIQVYADDALVYDSRLDEYRLLELSYTEGLNKSGTAIIKMAPNHPAFNRFVSFRTVVTIYRDGDLLFRGRALTPTDDLYNRRTITCEGEMGFFLDSVMEPYLFQDSPANIFAAIIEAHNAKTDDFKQFVVGSVTVTDANDYVRMESTQAEQLSSTLDKLIERCGGYLVFTTNAEGKRVVNWLAEVGYANNQTIEFGQNLTDYTREDHDTPPITVLYPYGAEDEDGNVLTIESVNGGVKYIQDDEAIAVRGRVAAYMYWDDVTDPQNLLRKAKEHLGASRDIITTLSLTAVDLAARDKRLAAFRKGDKIRVVSKPHGLDEYFLLTDKAENLLTLVDGTINLGKEKKTLTGQGAAGDRKSASDLQRTAQQLRAEYQTNTAKAISETQSILTSLIQQTSEALRLEVSKTYATNDQLESKVSTSMEQLSDSFTFSFNELRAVVDANDAEARAHIIEQASFIRFENGNIVLGRHAEGAMTLTLENDLIVFKKNGQTFGWWDGVDFHTGNIIVEVNERAQFGNFAFVPRSNGSLSFLKVGG